jgi:tetratricopeptide (TPR) repeat protein
MGRHDAAVGQARKASELDPLSLASQMIVSWILYFARRYDEAIAQGLRTLELDPNYATALRILGWAYEETGRYAEAVAAHRRASDLSGWQPNFAGQLGRAYALAGQPIEARELLARLQETSEVHVSSLDIAIILTALDEIEPALEQLERALEEHDDHLPYLKVNPRVDRLRDEPRFKAVLERMGLATAT